MIKKPTTNEKMERIQYGPNYRKIFVVAKH
jgi:hypothetical protein